MPQPQSNESKQDFLKRCTAEVVAGEGRSAEQAYAMCNVSWENARSERQALNLAVPVESFHDAAKDESGFLITAYTGKPIERFFGDLVIDTAGIKTKTKIPILREHARDRVVGFGLKSWVEGGNLYIKGDYSKKTRDAQEVMALAAEGFPWQASIGVWPKKVKVLESPDETMIVNGQELAGPLEVWTEAEVKEVSFVALGADDNTAAINFSDGPAVKVKIERGQPQIIEEGHTMPISLASLEKDAPELLKEIRGMACEEGWQAGKKEGEQLERERVLEILQADGDAAVARQAIEAGTPAAETFKLFFEAEKAKRGQALSDLETQAPESLGQTEPQVPAAAQDPEMELDAKARERAREKNIGLDAAMLEVAAENPQLLARWNPAAGLL